MSVFGALTIEGGETSGLSRSSDETDKYLCETGICAFNWMEPIAVIGRVHALDDKSGGDHTVGLGVCESTVTWIHHAEEKQFVLNHIVDASESPSCVVGGDMIAAAAAGTNTAVLAIGQSTTLFDPDGLIAYVTKGLLNEQCTVSLSLVEVYGDVATDVLHGKPHAFRPQFHRLIGGYGPDVTRIELTDATMLKQAPSANTRSPLGASDVGFRLEQGPTTFAECVKLLADDLPLDKVPLQASSSLLEGDLQGLRDHLEQVKRQLNRESKSLHHDSLELDHQQTRATIKNLESLVHTFQKPALERTDDWLKFKRRVDNDETKLGTKVLAWDRTVHHIHLVRLHDDRLFSGVIGYHVAASDSKMSRDKGADVVLFGGGAGAASCELQVPEPGTVEFMVAMPGTTCLINGLPLTVGVAPRPLAHGDTLTCGRRNVFRVVNPNAPSQEDDHDNQHVRSTSRKDWLDRGAVLQSYRHPLAAGLTHEDAQRRCHVALASILERIASIRTMFAQSVVDLDDESDVHDVMLQVRGAAPPPKYMATHVRPETIRRLSAAAIAEMNVLESRIYSRNTMKLLDAVDEFDAMCHEMDTPLTVHAVPMVNHAVTTNDDDPLDRMQLSTDVWVVLENPSNGRERLILRPAEFELRLAVLRTLFHIQPPIAGTNHGASPSSPQMAPSGGGSADGNPLQLASCEERIGVARVHLGKLAYYFDVEDALPIVSDAGQVVGHLMVQIQPHVAQNDKRTTHRKDVVKYVHRVNHDVDKEEELREAIGMGVTVAYRVNVRGARGLPPQLTSNVFVEYVFFEDSTAHATAPSVCKSRHPVIEQAFMHPVHVTEEFCQYVATGALEFQVFGECVLHGDEP
ncbi:hypothetical protein DYB37_000616 [Aphanomyces astaci]|uniref:Kinesin motor domain-containing protein n=1 Tax=Aphanomyces astaci TaxID=112090 RepID=A0A3R6YJL6_APHAT|nr:hypothetical protein DYB35_000444 [Aphanomyces astaci]RHZ16484.1 hypothetical protein DYB37_000616 [Aphanomyces astaci]